MNSVARLVTSNEIPELLTLTDKDIQKLERLRKLLRKQESTLRGTIASLGELGAQVIVRHGNQMFDIAQVQLTFERLK